MGKGLIMSGGTNGEYQVKINYAYRSRIEQKIVTLNQSKTKLQDRLTQIENQIETESDPEKLEDLNFQRSVTKLQIAAINKDIEYYQTGMPPDETVAAWCADLTEDLSGYVGTIEIPGEQTQILIRPGYNGRAVFSAARDGQLMPPIAGAPWQCLLNKMLLPGWQRHKPIYRVGTIESIDYSANTATVCLDPAYSSQQYLPAVDGVDDAGCSAANPVESQIADFCSRNPGHPLCTNDEAGEEINLSDARLAQLQLVNQTVNQEFGRAQDPSGYRLGDSWDVLSGGDKGDCEDFALTKMQRLVDTYGWNPRDLKIITAYVPHIGEYHAMLAVRTSNRGLVICDVNNDAVLQNGKTPYRLHRIALTKDEWTAISRKVEGATVEYMTCNSLAFIAGDRVVVEFPNKNYTTAKVVGFEEEPRACDYKLYHFFNGNLGGEYAWSAFVMDLQTQICLSLGADGLPYQGSGRASFRAGSGMFVAGGTHPSGGSQTVYQYAHIAGSWAAKTGLPLPGRAYAAGFPIGGKGVVSTGGYSVGTSQHPYSDTDMYDPETDSWTSKEDCTISRFGARGFDLNGKAHILCGHIGYFYSIISGQWHYEIAGGHKAWDYLTDSWDSKTEISEDRAFHHSFSLDGFGYTFGGQIEGLTNPATRNNKKYDPTSDTWESIVSVTPPGTGFVYQYGRGINGVGYIPHRLASYSEYHAATDSLVGRLIDYSGDRSSYATFLEYSTGEIA